MNFLSTLSIYFFIILQTKEKIKKNFVFLTGGFSPPTLYSFAPATGNNVSCSRYSAFFSNSCVNCLWILNKSNLASAFFLGFCLVIYLAQRSNNTYKSTKISTHVPFTSSQALGGNEKNLVE